MRLVLILLLLSSCVSNNYKEEPIHISGTLIMNDSGSFSIVKKAKSRSNIIYIIDNYNEFQLTNFLDKKVSAQVVIVKKSSKFMYNVTLLEIK